MKTKLLYLIILFLWKPETNIQETESVYSKCIPAVGLITDRSGAVASGFFINPVVFITNHHVTEDLDLKTAYIKMNDKRTFAIRRIVREYKINDLAVIEIKDECENTLELSEESVRKHDVVYSIGNPTDEDMNVDYFKMTKGRIRKIDDDSWFYDSEKDYIHEALVIQHTAVIKPGNSGGPLLNEDGKVIGVNTFFYDDSLNYAVHVKELREILKKDDIAFNENFVTEKKFSKNKRKLGIREKVNEVFEQQYTVIYENRFILAGTVILYYIFAVPGSILIIAFIIYYGRKKKQKFLFF